MSDDIYNRLIALAREKAPKIVCGFLIGNTDGEKKIVEDIYPLPTRSGLKIHFKPNWKEYRKNMKRIENEERRSIIGEFHTHPNGIETLNINDKRILRRLRVGFWIIATPDNVVPWFFEAFEMDFGFKEICKKLKLKIINKKILKPL